MRAEGWLPADWAPDGSPFSNLLALSGSLNFIPDSPIKLSFEAVTQATRVVAFGSNPVRVNRISIVSDVHQSAPRYPGLAFSHHDHARAPSRHLTGRFSQHDALGSVQLSGSHTVDVRGPIPAAP